MIAGRGFIAIDFSVRKQVKSKKQVAGFGRRGRVAPVASGETERNAVNACVHLAIRGPICDGPSRVRRVGGGRVL